jgi:hypothetical protein
MEEKTIANCNPTFTKPTATTDMKERSVHRRSGGLYREASPEVYIRDDGQSCGTVEGIQHGMTEFRDAKMDVRALQTFKVK